MRTIRDECLSQSVIFGERHLRHLVGAFVDHYNAERFRQGLGGSLIVGNDEQANDNHFDATIQLRSRLGGVLNFYYRRAG